MRTTSDTWKSIVANGEFHMESVARIYGATGDDENGIEGYDDNGDMFKEYATITAPVISRSLLSGDALSVGNAIAGQLKFAVMTTDTIPKSAKIVILARVKDDENVSEWLEFGTFWIDHRTVTDNIIDIEAYDAMKKGNQPYADNSQAVVWPKTIAVVVTRIAEQMGVEIDSRTVTDVINDTSIGDLDIVLKPTDEMSLLDILGHIGAILGGNWTITPDNELRYVQITLPIELKGYLLDNEENIITTYQGNKLLWQGDEGSDEEDEDTVDVLEVGIVINSLTTASKYTVSKVTLALDSEHVYTVGDDSGYELVASTSNPYASADMAQLLYSRVQGVEYDPFEASNAIYDPATELGDFTVIGTDISSVVYSQTQTLNIGFSGDVSAPGRDEMEDEYPYQTLTQKTQYAIDKANKDIGIVRSEITQLPDSILLQVSQTYETKENATQNYSSLNVSLNNISATVGTKVGNNEIRSKFALDTTNITLSAGEDSQGHATGQITFNAGALVVNSTNFSLDADGIMSCSGANINGDFVTSKVYFPETENEYTIINEWKGSEYTYKYNSTEVVNIKVNTTVLGSSSCRMYNIIGKNNAGVRLRSGDEMYVELLPINSTIYLTGRNIRLAGYNGNAQSISIVAQNFNIDSDVLLSYFSNIKKSNSDGTTKTAYSNTVTIGDKTVEIINGLIFGVR